MGPVAAGASADFSADAVIYEDAYENMPGVWVPKRSSRVRLNVSAKGGANGGTLSVSAVNLGKLRKLAGAGLPLGSVSVPANEEVAYSTIYEAETHSDATNDIEVVCVFAENGADAATTNKTSLTSVKIELTPTCAAPGNSCAHRHILGAGEYVSSRATPEGVPFAWRDKVDVSTSVDGREFWAPYVAGRFSPQVAVDGVAYDSDIQVFEPRVVCKAASWSGERGVVGEAGHVEMKLQLYVEPRSVSFEGLYMLEIPDDDGLGCAGYYTDTDKGGSLSHSSSVGAGKWSPVLADGFWTTDHAGAHKYAEPWSDGWKEWKIPVGWGIPGFIKGRVTPDPTTQRFEIDAKGTVTIRKYGHAIRRAADNKVWLDGVRVN